MSPAAQCLLVPPGALVSHESPHKAKSSHQGERVSARPPAKPVPLQIELVAGSAVSQRSRGLQ